MDFFSKLFDTSDFIPPPITPELRWLHILSDLATWGAYTAIPVVLAYFLLRRKGGVPFPRVFWLFAAFILVDGATHLMGAVLFWWPAYRLDGLLKLATAAVTWAAVGALVSVVPRALAFRSPAELEREVAERTREVRGLATLVENAHDAIYTRAVDDVILTWNAGAERLYGYTAAEMIGRSCLTVVPPDCHDEMREKHARLLRGEEVEPFETQRLHKNGQTVFVSVALTAITDTEGRVGGMAWFARDVTARKQAEDARNDALEYAANIVETVREPMLVLDGGLRVRTANRSFYQAFRVTTEDTEGRLVYDLGNGQWDIPALRTLLEDILPQNTTFDDFEVSHEFPGVGRRVMLVNARRMYRPGNHTVLILLAIEDITERRRLEDERRELETRFTSLVKNIRDHSIFSLDPLGHITSWNHEAEKILGFTEAEALGQHFSIIFTPEDLEAGIPAQELSIAMCEGRAVDERWHSRKGGERFWALGIVTPTTDARGAHTGYSKILRDMTDRKRAEEALRREHEFSESVVETAQTVVLVLDREGRILRINAYLEDLSGWRLEEVQGKDWFETFLPERDRQRMRELFDRALGGERILGNVNPIVTKDGRVRDIEWFDAPLKLAEGEPIGLLGIGQDITERKRSELALQAAHQRLVAVVESAPSLIVVTDRGGRVVHFNMACEALTGYRREEVLGDTILDRLVPAGWRSAVAARFADLHAPELREPHENPWLTRAGDERLIEWRCLTLPQSEQTSSWFLVGFGIDVTERKRAEEELRRSERRERERAAELVTILDAVPTPVFIAHDPDCLHITGNRAADALLRNPRGAEASLTAPEETKPRHFRVVKNGRDLSAAELPAQRAARGIPVQDFEFRLVFDDGTTRDMLAYATPLADEESRPRGAINVLVDITERKRAEERLALQARQQAGIAALGQKALIGEPLPDLMDEAVRTVADILGIEFVKVLELLPGGDRLLLRAGVGWKDGLVGTVTVSAGRGSQAGYTLLCREPVVVGDLAAETRFDGPPLLTEHGVVSGISCAILGTAGEPYGVIGTHARRRREFMPDDITFLQAVANLLGSVIQRKSFEDWLRAGEERMRAILNTATDAIITINRRGVIDSVNPAAQRMFGYPAAEMVGRNVVMLMPPPYRDEHDGYLARYLATGEKHIIGIGREVEGRRKDGTVFPIDLAVSEVDHLNLFTGIIRDITDRRRAEQIRQQLVARLTSITEDERRRISRELHDETSQRLAALVAGLKTVRGQPGVGGDAALTLEGLQEQANQVGQAVHRIAWELRPAALDSVGLEGAMRSWVERWAGWSGVPAKFRSTLGPERLPPEVETQLYRLVSEALTNVGRHANATRAGVLLDRQGNVVIVAVEDNGTGFDPDAAGTPGGRSPLGLLGMRERAALLGGTLHVESEPGRGTTVLARIPLPRPDRPAAGETASEL